ncbi:MAG: ATP-binding protein [Cyanobacteriota bacterium]
MAVPLEYVPSSELITLCQSQIRLLQQTVAMDWGGLYLTPAPLQTGGETVVTLGEWGAQERGLNTLPREEADAPEGELFSSALVDPLTARVLATPQGREQPLVLPLLHQEQVLGLLVTQRYGAPWQDGERRQLELFAQTLAIACLWDLQQFQRLRGWQWERQRHQQDREHWRDLLHQLKNPLTALRTFGKLLLRRWSGDEKTQSIVEGIVREGQHLQELLESFSEEGDAGLPLKELSGAALPLLPPQPETLPLAPMRWAELLEPILLAETAIAQDKGITLCWRLEENGSPILAHAPSLREVLSNLLDNALKYTPSQGTVSLSPCAHPQNPQQWQGLAIADTGYGIPPEDQPHIFERRYRGQQAQGEIPGTGLGLAIVRDLMTRMGGEIELLSPNPESQNPQWPGTVFRLWLLKA